jgi:hypothetical protein
MRIRDECALAQFGAEVARVRVRDLHASGDSQIRRRLQGVADADSAFLVVGDALSHLTKVSEARCAIPPIEFHERTVGDSDQRSNLVTRRAARDRGG